jgi:hypothetical protein
MTCVVAVSAIVDKTPGIATAPHGSSPPPGGGAPAEELFLKGTLSYDGGAYKIAVEALPGYVVPLVFVTPDLQSWAASHLGQDITVWGHWDKNDLMVFVVQSTNPS